MHNRFKVKPWMVLVALAVLFTGSLVGTYLMEKKRLTGTALGSVAIPVQQGAAQTTGSVKGFFGRLFGTRDVDREYQDLLDEIIVLRSEVSRMEEIERENERLYELIGFQETIQEYEYIPARIISKDPGSWFFTFNLDCGRKQGVETDMCVVSKDGLVGRITEVGANWCKVLCLIDRSSAVPVIIERTRDQGILRGATDAGSAASNCEVYYLNANAELIPGDLMLTSNIGGIFPKGIPVGRVLETGRDAQNADYAIVEPLVDFARLENVMVIKGERPSDFEARDDEANATPAP